MRASKFVATVIVVSALVIAGRSFAQNASPEGQALFEYRQCVKEAALRYAVLNQPMGDIADAAMASCFSNLENFQEAVNTRLNLPNRAPVIAFARESVHMDAMTIIAEAKMAGR